MNLRQMCTLAVLCTIALIGVPMAAQMTVSNTGSTGTSGFNATEGTPISSTGGSSGSDSMWADNSIHRWVMSNYGGTNKLVGAWPCNSQGCIPMSGAVNASYYPETPLNFPTGGPGLPLISGTLSSGVGYPQWGGGTGLNTNQTFALDLQTGNTGSCCALALASELPNDSGGTTLNKLALVNTPTSGSATALKIGTGNYNIPSYIVVAGAGNSGNAQLALDGEALCVMDSNSSSTTAGLFVVASTTTGFAGDCTTTATPSFGTWIVGQMISSSTVQGSTALVLVHPGYRAFGSLGSLSNSSGTIVATATTSLGTAASGDVVTSDGSGNVTDSHIASSALVTTSSTLTQYAPVIGNGSQTVKTGPATGTINSSTTLVTAQSSPTTKNLASWDGNGNLQDAGVAGTSPFIRLTTYTNSTTTLSTVVTSENIPASTNASFSCSFTWSGQTTNTTALTISITTPTSPTAFDANVIIESSNTAPKPLTLTASGSVTGTAVVSGGQNYYLSIYGTLQNGSNAGTLLLQAAESGGGTVTINRGGFCKTFY